MAKVLDITEKLGMRGRPQLKIGDTSVEVDNRAKTILQVLAVVNGDAADIGPEDVERVYGLLFDAKARKKLDALELDFEDFNTVIMSAVDLVIGGDDEGGSRDPGYSVTGDFGLLAASLRMQYGLRVNSEEFDSMTWDELSDLLAGLTDATPIVRLAQVRTETDREALKQFSPEQRRERSAWQARKARRMDQASVTQAISSMQQTFSKMFGGV